MSFRTFAYGLPDFHYDEAKCIDGSDFDVSNILAILQKIEPAKIAEAVAQAAVKRYTSVGIADFARLDALHLLSNSVSFIAMNPNADGAHISLSLTVKHHLWPDCATFTKYDFTPGDSPGVEFVHAISKNLTDAGFDNWGTLMSLAIVLGKYCEYVDGTGATPKINFSLTRSTVL